jgi:FkbM family methyltransferase
MGMKQLAKRLSDRYTSFRNIQVIDRRVLHELWERNHLRRLFEHYQVDCVFDVGANYGQYADLLRRKTGFTGLIISFEPIPAAAAALREKAKGQSNWVIEEVALARTDGECTFNIMKSSQFSSLSAPRHDEVDMFRGMNLVQEAVTVRTENLESAFRRLQQKHGFRRPFLKLDTQGFDVEIVSSARETMRQFIGLQSELAIKKLYASSVDFRSAISLYEECGFQLSAFVPNNEGHFPQLIETDCIMVRDDLIQSRH